MHARIARSSMHLCPEHASGASGIGIGIGPGPGLDRMPGPGTGCRGLGPDSWGPAPAAGYRSGSPDACRDHGCMPGSPDRACICVRSMRLRYPGSGSGRGSGLDRIPGPAGPATGYLSGSPDACRDDRCMPGSPYCACICGLGMHLARRSDALGPGGRMPGARRPDAWGPVAGCPGARRPDAGAPGYVPVFGAGSVASTAATAFAADAAVAPCTGTVPSCAAMRPATYGAANEVPLQIENPPR